MGCGVVADSGESVVVHRDNRVSGPYIAVKVPVVEGHTRERMNTRGYHHFLCTCGEWEKRDGCGPCLNAAWLEHLNDVAVIGRNVDQ
jgi:hypothetical protein